MIRIVDREKIEMSGKRKRVSWDVVWKMDVDEGRKRENIQISDEQN